MLRMPRCDQARGGPTFFVLGAGYLFTYWHTKQADGRKANIERINEQLRELYGPLLASVTATQSAYNAMVKSATVKTPFHAHQDDAATAEAFRSAVTADPQGPVAVTYRCAPTRCGASQARPPASAMRRPSSTLQASQ